MKLKLISLLAAIFINHAFAQTAPKADAVSIRQQLNKMQVLGSVLYVAAHPDDENTRLLAYLATEKHYRTGYLSLTRGDGGQNLIGNEQSELLGLIRTQELLAARRVDGAEQFFTRANDFGFSKGPGETLKIWDKEKVLSDVVWVIRRFKPDVMICRFPTTGEGGHGHHTSSAILAQEAFKAAADPKRFPEQLKYVQVWQAKRLLWNTFSFGGMNTTAEDQFKIDVGVYNPLLGKGYGELAAESRSNHRSQGFGSAAQRGSSFEYFKTILGDAPKTDLMDGVNTTWDRVPDGAAIQNDLATIKKNFDDEHPEASVNALVAVLSKIEKVKNSYWRAQKVAALRELILACAGVWTESYATAPTYALGDKIAVRTQAVLRRNADLKLNEIIYSSPEQFPTNKIFNDQVIEPNALITLDGEVKATTLSQPFWLKHPHGIGTYVIDSADEVRQKTLPENIGYQTAVSFKIAGKNITVSRALQYKYVDPAKGEIYQPVEVTPTITADMSGKNFIFKTTEPKAQTIQVNLKAFAEGSGSVWFKPAAGWKVSPERINFTDKKKGEEWSADFTVTPTDNQPKNTMLTAVAEINGKQSLTGIQRIWYDHIPHITLFPPAQVKLVDIDLKTPGSKKIGYIVGAGDLVDVALKQVGYDVHYLTEADILHADLSQYQAIVTGVRYYNVNARVAVEQPKLLDYVKNGGTLLVQYNTFNNLQLKDIGPYPFSVVNQRVTEEAAPVTFAQPQSKALTYPNKITSADFEGWVQERGLYFVSNVDAQYEAPLQIHDAGEQPNNGSLILANYGKGRFVYTSLSFFRELPAGVPGAYRLFINLLSKP